MRRREFIAGLAGAAPCRAIVHAQSTTVGKGMHIAILSTGAVSARRQAFDAFKERLRDLGWIEDRNLVIHVRWADGPSHRFHELAAEVNNLSPDVVVAFGGPAALAAKESISPAIPIVIIAADAVGLGLVSSLARPGGNITGLTDLTTELSAKRLEILKETLPRLAEVLVLWNADNPGAARTSAETEAAGNKMDLHIRALPVRVPQDLDAALETCVADQRISALLVVHDPFTLTHRSRIAELAAKCRLPAIYGFREFVEAGGLMSYGTNFAEAYRRLASATDKILRGAHPGDLPVEQPTKFELVTNLKAARALGLTIPPTLLARADEVIE
jgi:putative ABC transport system substrate-binding protein